MKKRLVSLLLAFSMMLTFMPVGAITAFAEETTGSSDTTVVASGNCGATGDGSNLKWTLTGDGALKITGSGAMKDYYYRPSSGVAVPGWYNYKSTITSIVFNDGITYIGDYAFYECSNLTSVTYTGYNGNANVAFPDSITAIGGSSGYAFANTGLKGTLKLPANLTTVGRYAFFNCTGLTGTLTLPPKLKTIEECAFQQCGFSGDLTFPDSVETIGRAAFYKVYATGNTGTLTLPKNLVNLGASSFEGCHFKGSLVIPDKVTTISPYAFKDSSFDGTLTLPKDLQTIDNGAFDSCKGLYGDLKIPDSVTTIGKEAFFSSSIGQKKDGVSGKLIFGENSQLQTIGEWAFANCSQLVGDLKLPDKVISLGKNAFAGCSGFNGTLTLPKTLTEIPRGAFSGCKNLTGNLVLPKGVTRIDQEAFDNCVGFTGTITNLDSVISIGQNAFTNCSFSRTLDLSNATNLNSIDVYAFASSNLEKIYLPKTVPSIGWRAFTSGKIYYPDYASALDRNEWKSKVTGYEESNTSVSFDTDSSKRIPICYYVDVTFNANDGTFDGSAPTKTVNGEANKLYRTENLTADEVATVGTPNRPGYHFVGWSLTQDGGVDDVLKITDGYLTIANNGVNSFGGVEDGMTLYAVYSKAASVIINDFAAADAEGTTIKAGNSHPFTLTGDAGTDTGAKVALTLSDNAAGNATLQYRNSDADEWQNVGNTTFDIATVKNVQFKVTAPDDATTATITLTATVQDASGNAIANATGDSVTFVVKAHENATVKIDAPTDKNVVAGDPSKAFTVTVDEKDDTGAKAKFAVNDNIEKFQYSDDNGTTWNDVTDLSKAWSKDDLNGKQFRVVPKNNADAGTATVTVTLVKADGTTEIADATAKAEYTVKARTHATVEIEGLSGKELVATVPHTFTVTVTPNDDVGEATLTLTDADGNAVDGLTANGTAVTADANTITLNKGIAQQYTLTLTPTKASETSLTLKATLKTADCAPETTATYTVRAYGKTAVAIDGLDNGTIKAGDDKTFTIDVVKGDDAGKNTTVEITVSGDNKDAVDKIQYRPADSTSDDGWTDVPAEGLPIGGVNGSKFRVVTDPDAKDGDVKLSVTVKNGDTELTHKDADFTVAKKIYSYPLTITNGKLVSVTDGETVLNIQLENGSASIPAGATVKVAFDGAAFADSGSKFGHWDITGLTQDDANKYTSQETFTFTMPAGKVTLEGMTQDSTIDDGPSIIGDIAIGATIVAGGAVLGYQTYSLTTGFLGDLWGLPYFPSNRSALALMLWQDAGKPMPASELLYPDVGQEEQDMDLQHAARWAMENELIPDKNNKDADLAPEEVKFFPNDAITKYSVLKAWKKAQELKKNA